MLPADRRGQCSAAHQARSDGQMNSAAQRFGSGRAGGNVMRALAVLGIVALLAAPTAYFHYAWTSAEQEMLETARADAEFLRERLLKQDVRARSSSADATDADEGGSSTARSIHALLQQLPPMEIGRAHV